MRQRAMQIVTIGWVCAPIASCGLFGTKDPPAVNIEFTDTVISLDPRDYRSRPALGTFGIVNNTTFRQDGSDVGVDLFVTPIGFRAPDGIDLPPGVVETMTTRDDHDIDLRADGTLFLEVSYRATPEVWQNGAFQVVLELSVGMFDPTVDSGAGPATVRRIAHPEAWIEDRFEVTIAFTWNCDVDGDNALAEACGGEDCHDQNATIGPGFPEICDRGDNDCNGLVDDDPIDGITWYFDGDNDGFGTDDASVVACRPPTNDYVSEPGDCQDGNPYVNPGIEDFCEDSVDNDCDGTTNEGCGAPPGP
ncbi:MAG TPA: putative metal-binding motif-containing protein [Myxococcota bacterium]|nr:putative metal-binding motif-containing protein [Myxococcota bacterium]